MNIETWWIWMAIAALFVIAEIFTAGFFMLWFGVGAAAAGIFALIEMSMVWQLGSFVILSLVLFMISRQFAERFTKKQPPGIGADRFISEKGLVIEEIDNIKNTGRVRIGKDEWRADSETDDIIPEGITVEVTRLDGTHVVVKTIEEGE